MNAPLGPLDPAQLPPAGLPGLDAAWSRLIEVSDANGTLRGWHILDSYAGDATRDEPELTLLCVHGNPTWSYLWRSLIAQAPSRVRVIAVDQLEMGFSERTGATRLLAERVADLGTLTSALGLTGPVVTVAHDWGGPVSLGWALEHREQLRGVVLLNTAVHQPPESPAPTVIRIARSGPLLRLVTERTDLFIRATNAMSQSFLSGHRMPADVARAYRAPYLTASRRVAVRDFVADIPLEGEHPSARALDRIADGIRDLTDVPVLLQWGPNDPVFSDLYLDDLADRLPHADIHRYERASHLVIEDAPRVVPDLLAWLEASVIAPSPSSPGDVLPPTSDDPGLLDELRRAADDRPLETALVEMGEQGIARNVTWGLLSRRVAALAGGLQARGITPGDRVSVLIPPSADLLAVVYACWSIGACVVIADTGLGAAGIRRAIRGAAPDHVIGIRAGMALARTLRIPGQRIGAHELAAIAASGTELANRGAEVVDPEAEAAVVFTSGATGPAKGVIYRHRQVAATVRVLRDHYSLTREDALVAAFAPWAVLGPALGITSVIPMMDVTKPRTLTARALSRATAAVGGTVLWASPAALTNVVATAGELDASERESFASMRLALCAGAPVPASLLREVAALMPHAEVRTPYGMTEALPLTDVTSAEIDAAGMGNGVLVGKPICGVRVAVAPLNGQGAPGGDLVGEADVTGEIAVQADHLRDGYDRLWATDFRANANPGWHRTGDVGHLDADGRLWVEGRLAHVVVTADGPVTPVGLEHRILTAPFVEQAAIVGVGPGGAAQLVAVVVVRGGARPAGHVLDAARTQELRRISGCDLAAVLVRPSLPVDIRHNSKVDRTELAIWAQGVLGGAGSS